MGGSDTDTSAFYSPKEGIDTIKNFTDSQGDIILVDSTGFDIGTGDYDCFRYDSSTGELFFKDTVFALLDPTVSGFDVATDLFISGGVL